jgi:hypothetical protein
MDVGQPAELAFVMRICLLAFEFCLHHIHIHRSNPVSVVNESRDGDVYLVEKEDLSGPWVRHLAPCMTFHLSRSSADLLARLHLCVWGGRGARARASKSARACTHHDTSYLSLFPLAGGHQCTAANAVRERPWRGRSRGVSSPHTAGAGCRCARRAAAGAVVRGGLARCTKWQWN